MKMKLMLLPLLAAFGGWSVAGELPDTGEDTCTGTGGMEPCSVSNSGDASANPRQDGRFGRDAAATAGRLTKVGGGEAGFDYSKVCNSGDVAGQGACPANPALGTGDNEWGCTMDNNTGLLWEVKLDDRQHLRHYSWTYTWYDPAANVPGQPDQGADANSDNCLDRTACDTNAYLLSVNAAGMCGFNDWRLPNKLELESLLHMGRLSPTIDPGYFPNTAPQDHWTGSTVAQVGGDAWVVSFSVGRTNKIHKQNAGSIRLVRGDKF